MQDIKISVILEGFNEIKMLSLFLSSTQKMVTDCWTVWVVSLISTLSIDLVEEKEICQGRKKNIKENN